jgi:hypothetical protein
MDLPTLVNKSVNSPQYWRTFLAKAKGEVEFLTSPGVYVTLDKNSFSNVNTPQDLETLYKVGRSIVIPLKGSGTVKLSEIHKSNVTDGETRKAYNLGDTAEGVMACAMAARFISKNEQVQIKHLMYVLNELKKTWNRGTSVQKTFLSKNKPQPWLRTKLFDEVTVEIKLAQANIDFLFTDEADEKSTLRQLMSPCLHYANSYEIATAAKIMYENGVKDYIEITSDGVSNQTGTKVDINLKINGMTSIDIPANLRTNSSGTRLNLTQISLKKDVNQFAQVGGWDIPTQQDFWGRILNVRLESISAVQDIYNTNAAIQGETGRNVAYVMRDLYQWANGQLQNKLNNPQWKEHLINMLHDMATKNEENVMLVELNTTRRTSERYNFLNLRPALLGVPSLGIEPSLVLESVYEESTPKKAGDPELPSVTIVAYQASTNTRYKLVKFRHKMEGAGGPKPKAIRNYVEKQAGLENFV